MNQIKNLLSRLTKPQICVIIAIAACAIAGGVLVYSEWEARQPMDFTIPEPIPAVIVTANCKMKSLAKRRCCGVFGFPSLCEAL